MSEKKNGKNFLLRLKKKDENHLQSKTKWQQMPLIKQPLLWQMLELYLYMMGLYGYKEIYTDKNSDATTV